MQGSARFVVRPRFVTKADAMCFAEAQDELPDREAAYGPTITSDQFKHIPTALPWCVEVAFADGGGPVAYARYVDEVTLAASLAAGYPRRFSLRQ